MKKLILLSAIAMSGLVYNNASAQIHFSINLGLRAPVVVEPAPVYDADYYYLPEVEAYYSVSNHCYYYNDGYSWVSAAYLPGAYRNYDWRTANHYAVREARPYLHNDVYRARYGGIEGRRDWNYRDDHSRVYADRDRMDHNQYRGHDFGGRPEQRFDNRGGGFDRNRPQVNDNRLGAPQNDNRGGNGGQQPQQNDNRGGFGGQQNDNRGNGQQQGQPQQGNNGRGGFDHGNDNNNGNNNSGRQGRGGRS